MLDSAPATSNSGELKLQLRQTLTLQMFSSRHILHLTHCNNLTVAVCTVWAETYRCRKQHGINRTNFIINILHVLQIFTSSVVFELLYNVGPRLKIISAVLNPHANTQPLGL